MLEPEYLRRVSEGSEQIASSLHDYIIQQIIRRIMLRIGRGEEYLLTSSDVWRIKTLQESGYLLEDITAEIANYTKRQKKEIKAAMEEAGVKALEADHKVYQAAGLSPEPLTQSPALIRLMERNMLATVNEWTNFTRTTAQAAQALYHKLGFLRVGCRKGYYEDTGEDAFVYALIALPPGRPDDDPFLNGARP